MKNWLLGFLALPALIFAGCNSGVGSNSLYNRKPGTGCTQCHNASFSPALDPLITNGSGTMGKHVPHVERRGIPCERCHFDYYIATTHMNGTFDTGNPSVDIVFFDSTNPTGTWTNDTGPGTGSCSSVTCHGGVQLDWYGTGLPACAACHIVQMGERRPVLGAEGDFGQNSGILSHHVTGTADPSADQCMVCHDMSEHMGGTVRLRNGDTGEVVVYSAGTPSTLEPFCLSCHDADGAPATALASGTPAAPFNDGSEMGVPPYIFATRIQSSWNKSYGHGANGNHPAGAKLTCLGTGEPGTGCHGSAGSVNGHGSVNAVLGSRLFNLSIGNLYLESDFDLCFNCHASYPGITKEETLGVKFGGLLDWGYGILTGPNGPNGWNPPYYIPALTTHFADHNDPNGSPLNDGAFWGENFNLHWFHLGGPTSLRGTGTPSGIVCVNCHDVHGSDTVYGALYDELVYTNTTTLGDNVIGEMTISAYTDDAYLQDYPTYCTFNCHTIQGPTKAWFTPIIE